MNIKRVQYLTKKNSIKKEKRLIREQYKIIKCQIKASMKEGKFYTFYHGYLFSDVVNKLRQKGFKLEKNNDYYEINWEI